MSRSICWLAGLTLASVLQSCSCAGAQQPPAANADQDKVAKDWRKAAEALNSLRNVGRALHAWVVPEQASVPEAWKVFDEAGAVKDKRIEDRLKGVGRQVARFAREQGYEVALSSNQPGRVCFTLSPTR